MDTKYVTGNLAVDTQFIRDNLSAKDKAEIEAQLRLIMSVGNGRIQATEGDNNERV
jgi:hypothetical protein